MDVSLYSLWFNYFFYKMQKKWSLLGTFQKHVSLLETFDLSPLNWIFTMEVFQVQDIISSQRKKWRQNHTNF